jgi:hypothetical protein
VRRSEAKAMHNYRAKLERRIKQFCNYLEPMDHRAHEVAHRPCFMIFEERLPDGSRQQPREDREPALAAIAAAFGESGASVVSIPTKRGRWT